MIYCKHKYDDTKLCCYNATITGTWCIREITKDKFSNCYDIFINTHEHMSAYISSYDEITKKEYRAIQKSFDNLIVYG